jgi:hypothetical protein
MPTSAASLEPAKRLITKSSRGLTQLIYINTQIALFG